MERTYLQWNLVNWITVVLMAAIGTAALGLVTSFFVRKPASAEEGE